MRARKKAASVAAPNSNHQDIFDEIKDLKTRVSDLWDKAGGHSKSLTPDQANNLAIGALSYRPVHFDGRAEKEKEKARHAMNMLLDWCNFDPNENGLTKVRPAQLVSLESAIRAARPLAEPSLSRPWIFCARDLWRRVSAINQKEGLKSGTSANSHTIKFISLVLNWAGHPGATPDAIRKELEKDVP